MVYIPLTVACYGDQERYAIKRAGRTLALNLDKADARHLVAQVNASHELLAALLALKNGDCWCDRYYDPACGHQARCRQAAEAVAKAESRAQHRRHGRQKED